jgi:1-acyl-sn-glycerol-3-phosphate acyltransferase
MIQIETEIFNKYPEFLKNSKIRKNLFIQFSKKIIHQDQINKFLTENQNKKDFDFINSVLDFFNINIKTYTEEIFNIPSKGKIIIIANHPLGAIDALALIKTISLIRKDIKIVANDFLSGIQNLNSILIKINNFKTTQSKNAIEEMYDCLKRDEALIIFPAGEVSRFGLNGLNEKKWNIGFSKIAQKTNSNILMVNINAKNSIWFYILSYLNKNFSTILLPNEMFRQKNKSIRLRISEVIDHKKLYNQLKNHNQLVYFLKNHLYQIPKSSLKFNN